VVGDGSRAFDAHAVDYLLKPYGDERFEVALTRAIRLVRSGASDMLIAQMQALLDGRDDPYNARILSPR
jgi:two-component system LytT family response regulator